MTITIIGAGYVGLVTAAVFSDFGNKVFVVDIDENRIKLLKKGKIPFFEPSLAELAQKNIDAKRLIFTTSYKPVSESQIVFICVGTPPKENGETNTDFLFKAVEETAKHITHEVVIAIKSTVPPGLEGVLEDIASKFAKGKFEFASCPEFLREGTAIQDSLHPDRVVIGGKSKKTQDLLLELHEPLEGERILTDLTTAQLIKYAANAFLATKVSFANAIANICERADADVEKVLAGIGADKRIGHHFLYPGVGYGGSCLPKDVVSFIAIAKNLNYDFELLRAVDAINLGQIEILINKIKAALAATAQNGKNPKGKKIAVLGLAFKPNTDDIREAPAIKIINHLLGLGVQITAFDPKAMDQTKRILPQIKYAKNEYDALKDQNAMVIVTEWPQFIKMDLKRAKKLLKTPVIIDGRNIINPELARKLGFYYVGMGR